MRINRPKVLAAARKYVTKGQHDRAITEYKKLVDADPSDVRTWLKIGDLHTRKGDTRSAASTYQRVAEHYAENGFFLKAVAVYKQILKLQPTRLDVLQKLGEMYENLELLSEALSTYEQVATSYARAGDMDNMLIVLGKMAEMDPDNIPVRIRNAEALSKAGRREDAASEFEAGAELLRDQGRIDDYLKVAERLLYHRPDDVDLARKLASMYLDRNDAKRSLGKLQLCFKSDPRDVETLELLARAFRSLGQMPKTISVYRELSRILGDAGRRDDRARILREILALDPNDGEARQALAAYAPRAPVARPPAPSVAATSDVASAETFLDDDEPELEFVDDSVELEIIDADDDMVLMVDDDDDDLDLEIDEDVLIIDGDDDLIIGEPEGSDVVMSAPRAEHIVTSEVAPRTPDRPVPTSIPPDIAREAQIARLLTECEVFQRYGLSEKVTGHLKMVLSIAPDHVEAREKLKDTYLSSGNMSGAAEQLLALATLFEADNPQVAQLYRRQADDLVRVEPEPAALGDNPFDDENDRTIVGSIEDLMPEIGFEIEAGDAATDAGGPIPAHTPVLDEPDVVLSDEFTTEAAFESVEPAAVPLPAVPLPAVPPPAVPPPAVPPPAVPPPAVPPVVSASSTVTSPKTDPAPQPEPPIHDTIPPNAIEATAVVSLRDVAFDDPAGLESSEVSGPADFTDESSRAEREAIERNSMPPGEVEEILDEVEFYIAQGLLDAGTGTLEDALGQYPGHPLLLDRLREIEEQRQAEASLVVPIVSEPVDDAFALAEKLAEELGPPDADDVGSDILDVDQVFAQFKRGVEAEIEPDDSETHFDLGIAYREMGLHDDACEAFKLAMSNQKRECLCHTMIGLCRAEQGRLTDAISCFKRGLYTEQKTETEEIGLYFELGAAYEALDDPEEAIYYYNKVVKREPGFRGVQGRIDRLKPDHTAPDAPLVLDDVDAAFDELMNDD